MDTMNVAVKREVDESVVEDEMIGGGLFLEEEIKKEPDNDPEGESITCLSANEIKKEPDNCPEGESITCFSANNNPLDIKSEDILVDDVRNKEGQEALFSANNDPLNIKSEDVNIKVTETNSTHDEMVGEIIEASGNIKQENDREYTEENSTTPSLGSKYDTYPGKSTCGICGFTFKRPNLLKKHSIVHKDPSEIPMYKCEKCPFESRHKSSLKSHDLNCHGNSSQLKKFSCEKCDFQTNQTNVFKRHLIVQHEPQAYVKTEKKIHKCKHCEYTAKKKFSLDLHSIIHKDPSDIYLYECSLCPFKSKRPAGLNNHMLIHKTSSETPLFKCELCTYETKWRHCLRNHLKVHEKNSEQLTIRKCDICDFTTNNIYSLEVHMKSHVEKPKKSFTCYNCGYQSHDKGRLKRHMLVHKPLWQLELFECATCGIKTKTKVSLKFHIITFHGPMANMEVKSNLQ